MLGSQDSALIPEGGDVMAYGDGGAVFTDDDELAAVLRSLRVHGQGSDRYDNVRIGINGRMGTIQAAIVLEKLKIFPDEIVARNAAAGRYAQEQVDAGYLTPEQARTHFLAWW